MPRISSEQKAELKRKYYRAYSPEPELRCLIDANDSLLEQLKIAVEALERIAAPSLRTCGHIYDARTALDRIKQIGQPDANPSLPKVP